jgi:hypothetical protein
MFRNPKRRFGIAPGNPSFVFNCNTLSTDSDIAGKVEDGEIQCLSVIVTRGLLHPCMGSSEF